MTNPIRKFFFRRSLIRTLWKEAEHKIVTAMYIKSATEDFEKILKPKQEEFERLNGEIEKLKASTTREDRETRKTLYPQRERLEKEITAMSGIIAKNIIQTQELRSQAAQLHHKLAFVRKHY